MTADEVKEKLIDQFRQWLNDPQRKYSTFHVERQLAPNPQNPEGPPVMLLDVKCELPIARVVLGEPPPLITPARGPLPRIMPDGKPPT